MKIEIERYYIFSNTPKGIKYYSDLQELKDNAPEQIVKFEEDMKKDNYYIGIGAEYSSNKDLGAIDFINKKDKMEGFNWCKDVESEEIDVPTDFREVLEYFLETL